MDASENNVTGSLASSLSSSACLSFFSTTCVCQCRFRETGHVSSPEDWTSPIVRLANKCQRSAQVAGDSCSEVAEACQSFRHPVLTKNRSFAAGADIVTVQ